MSDLYRIESYDEWKHRPSYHGSYDDYVRHMRGMAEARERERDRRNNEEIARLVSERLSRQ